MNSNFRLSVRYYIATLSIAFLVLGVFVVYMLFSNPPQGFSTPPSANNATLYLPSSTEKMSIFLTVSSGASTAPHTIALLYFDPVGGQVPIISIPPRCLVKIHEKNDTLENVFLRDGVRGAKQAFEEYSNLSFDRYLALTDQSLTDLLDLSGRVDMEMPSKLSLSNGVVVNQGLQSLDGVSLCKVLETLSAQDNTTSSTILTSKLLAEAVNDQLALMGTPRGERAFQVIANKGETDISYKDYTDRIKAAEFMKNLEGEPSYGLILQGTLNDGKNTFTFSDKSLSQLGDILQETA